MDFDYKIETSDGYVIKTVFDNNWYEKYKLAKQYFIDNGDLYIPHRYVENGVRLGVWIHSQRLLCREGKIDINRKEMLDKIGMVWYDTDISTIDEIKRLKKLREELIQKSNNNRKRI